MPELGADSYFLVILFMLINYAFSWRKQGELASCLYSGENLEKVKEVKIHKKCCYKLPF